MTRRLFATSPVTHHVALAFTGTTSSLKRSHKKHMHYRSRRIYKAMCGRYTLDDIDAIFDRFKVAQVSADLSPNYNAAPSQLMPVVIRNNPNFLEQMLWGLIPSWTKQGSKPHGIINARAETVAEKPSFRRPLLTQRCLVPASGFYEWKNTSQGKVPYYIRLKSRELFAFAGIYDIWHDAQGRALRSYCIITTEPNELMQSIHTRMPVILRREAEDVWLNRDNQDADELLSLLVPYASGELEAYPVSKRVNSPSNNDRSLIEPF
jgi:putative SOS response-associated peptidase YedK